jgi:hypothetical protein
MLNICGIVAAILKMATGRNFSMLEINSGHHYLPTYQTLIQVLLMESAGRYSGREG